jgi:hypothetical protein
MESIFKNLLVDYIVDQLFNRYPELHGFIHECTKSSRDAYTLKAIDHLLEYFAGTNIGIREQLYDWNEAEAISLWGSVSEIELACQRSLNLRYNYHAVPISQFSFGSVIVEYQVPLKAVVHAALSDSARLKSLRLPPYTYDPKKIQILDIKTPYLDIALYTLQSHQKAAPNHSIPRGDLARLSHLPINSVLSQYNKANRLLLECGIGPGVIPIILCHGDEYMLMHHTIYELLECYVENYDKVDSDFRSLFEHLGVEQESKVFKYMERYYTAHHAVDPAWSPAAWFLNNAKCHLTISNGVITDLEPGQSLLSNPSATAQANNGV